MLFAVHFLLPDCCIALPRKAGARYDVSYLELTVSTRSRGWICFQLPLGLMEGSLIHMSADNGTPNPAFADCTDKDYDGYQTTMYAK